VPFVVGRTPTVAAQRRDTPIGTPQ